jgi:hypothetical protein
VDRRNYFDATDALLYVIDAADRRRLEETGKCSSCSPICSRSPTGSVVVQPCIDTALAALVESIGIRTCNSIRHLHAWQSGDRGVHCHVALQWASSGGGRWTLLC